MMPSRRAALCLFFAGLLFAFAAIERSRLLTAAQASIDPDVVAHFQAGQRALREGRFQLAIQEFTTALRLEPGMIQAEVNLGLAYHALGRYGLAAAEFEKALRQQPNLLGANLFLGIDYLKLGQTAKAIPPLETTLRIDPSNFEAHRALVTCYEAQSNYLGAVKQFDVISSLERNTMEATYDLGSNYYDLAMYLVGQLSRRYSNSAWANRLGGDLLADQDFWVDAAIRYREALKIEPFQPGLRASLGEMYVRQGKFKDAEIQFEKELERDPENERALLGMAEVHLVEGSTQQALECITKIWETFAPFLAQHKHFPSGQFTVQKAEMLTDSVVAAPDGPAKQYLLSCLYRVAGQNEKAQRHWEVMEDGLRTWREKLPRSQSRPTVVNTCGNHRYLQCVSLLQHGMHLTDEEDLLLGKAWLELGQYVKASKAFAALLSRRTDDLEASYWLARSSIRLADSYFTQVLNEYPDSWRAHQLRGQTEELHDKYGDAIKEYRAAERLHADDPELLEALGRAYLGTFQLPQAETELRKALKLDPTSPLILYYLGRACLLQHHTQESIRYFHAALQFNPNLLKARAGLGRAYMREGKAALALPELREAASIDFHGDVHYLLYLAYRELGNNRQAQEALARSQELRKTSASRHQAKVAAAFEEEHPR